MNDHVDGHGRLRKRSMETDIRAIGEYEIDPTRICFEITETAAIADADQALLVPVPSIPVPHDETADLGVTRVVGSTHAGPSPAQDN